MGRRCLDGGEWLKAPASSAFLQEMLSKADWQALRPKNRAESAATSRRARSLARAVSVFGCVPEAGIGPRLAPRWSVVHDRSAGEN